MDLDPQTLLLAMLLVVLLAAGACFLIWLQDRKQTAMLWMASSAVLICVAVIGRATLPFLAGVASTNSMLLISFGLSWTAFRSLRDQPPRMGVVILPVVIWLGLCLVPEFMANLDLRVGLGLLLLLIPVGLTARELWLKGQGSRIIRWPVLTVLGIQVVLMLHRAVRSLVWPNVAYAPFEMAPGFEVMMLDLMTITLTFSFSVIAFVKDQSVRWHRDAARYDFLTGIGNRLHFEENLHRHFLRARMSGRPLTLIMIDADAFKEYNDLYGHPVGDRCLQAIANAIVMSCRPTDIVGRYGGEEFAALLLDANPPDALLVAERMLNEVRKLRLEHARSSQGFVTISIGVASLLPDSDQATPDDLVEAADRALYRAKQDGKDRICLAVDECEFSAIL